MAYDTNSLVRIGSVPFAAGISKSEFYYATADTKAAVLAANYFNADYKRFDIADRITVVTGIGGVLGTTTVIVTSAKGVSPVVVAAAGQQALTDNTGGTIGQPLALTAAQQKIILPVQLVNLTNAENRKIALPFAFKVLDAKFRVGEAVTTAAKLATLTTQITGVACTGGVIALTSAAATPSGALIAGTAITALQDGVAGDTLEAVASAVTAFVEGDGYVEWTVINKDLANALASLNAA